MKEFYYQIKGRTGEKQSSGGFFGSGNWSFPPIFSGKVEAKDKKEAKKLIEEEYGREFPMRVLKKDLDSNEFLLSIKEITDQRTKKLFEIQPCSHCGTEFRVIDLYNDANTHTNSFCSDKCANDSRELRRIEYNENYHMNGNHLPVIYKITNKITDMCYVGKTNQAFTLRWYQHFFQGSGTKFHEAIKEHTIENWLFEVIEIVKIESGDFKNRDEADKFIIEREQYWIKTYNTIEKGYNSRM